MALNNPAVLCAKCGLPHDPVLPCPGMRGEKSTDDVPPLPRADWRDAELPNHRMERIRIEALRAAAVVMGQAQNPNWRGDSTITLALARDFERYLEAGK